MTHELEGSLDSIEVAVYILIGELREKGTSDKAEVQFNKARRRIKEIRDAVPEARNKFYIDGELQETVYGGEESIKQLAEMMIAITQEQSDE